MDLRLDYSLGDGYKSKAQRMRLITEGWVANNSFCPVCGSEYVSHYKANKPVADFFCNVCGEDFELKSKDLATLRLPRIFADGAYNTMISRLNSNKNPNFFFLIHNHMFVQHFFAVPKYFFTPSCIEKRQPLSQTAHRAGWIGCNIIFSDIPSTGVIFLVKNAKVEPRDKVLDAFERAKQIKTASMQKRGWLLDVLKCVELADGKEFTLSQIYANAEKLRSIYVNNRNVEAKIRQQLQFLRDKNLIVFLGNGVYRKLF